MRRVEWRVGPSDRSRTAGSAPQAGRSPTALARTNISEQLDEALSDLTVRAQRAGLVRDDLVAEDLPRILSMINSVLWTMDPSCGGWRRYLVLMLDAISTAERRELPQAVPIQHPPSPENWPI